MADKDRGRGWKGQATREYHQVDSEFVRDVLPLGTVDGSSFGLIADATEYRLVQEGDEVHIRPEIAQLREILNSLRRGGMRVRVEDAHKSVERFAELWEERIREADKWDEVIARAREADQIAEPGELEEFVEERQGLLSRLKRRLFGG